MASRGRGIAKSCLSAAAAISPWATIPSASSRARASASDTWIVTGTTRSPSQASIIAGR